LGQPSDQRCAQSNVGSADVPAPQAPVYPFLAINVVPVFSHALVSSRFGMANSWGASDNVVDLSLWENDDEMNRF